MMVMSTYGTNERVGRFTERKNLPNNQPPVTFQYPEVIANHFKYRHMVDDHNGRRHDPISLEVIWATKTWPNRVFAFLLSITEINVMYAANYFLQRKKELTINFRKDFAKALIYNHYVLAEELHLSQISAMRLRNREHCLTTIPRKKFKNGRLVRSNVQYAQLKCVGCAKRIRTYCLCSPGVYRCRECYAKHVLQANIDAEAAMAISSS